MDIRLARLTDGEAIKELDETTRADEHRQAAIDRWLRAGQCWVAVEGRLVGYGALTYTFYGRGFIEMLHVGGSHRRRGVGLALVERLCEICETADIFTSTNQSNAPMQRLLLKTGFKGSGVIENLDEGDPELVYFKRIRNKTV
jgi:ribosomal protein S18 acetylase RimI-like enzyme